MVWNPFLRFPRTSLLLTLLLCLPLFLKVGTPRVSSEARLLLEGDSRNLATYEKVESVLGETEVVVVNLEHSDLFSAEGLDCVRRISQAFAREPGVWDVKSLTHSSKPVRKGLSFQMVPFVPAGPLSEEERIVLRTFCLEHPLVRNVMVSADGKNSLITVTYRGRVESEAGERTLTKRVDEILEPFRREGLKLWALGLPIAAEEIRDTLRADLRRLLPVGLALLGVVLWLTFRSWRVLAMVLAQQAIALLLLPGIIASSGFRLSLFSAMVLPLIGSVQLTWLAHIFGGLRRGFRNHQEPERAFREMMAEVFKPSVFAALTTLAGMLALALAEVEQIRDFGRLGALGVAAVFFLTFGPGLAAIKLLLRYFPTDWSSEGRHREGNRPLATRWIELLRRMRWAILGLSGLLLLLSAWGIQFIRTDIRAVEFLSKSSPTRQAMESVDREYGGVNFVQISFDTGRTNGLNDLEFLSYLEAVHQYAHDQPEPSGVYSYASLLAMMNQIWEGGDTDALHLPESRLLLGIFVLALQSYNYPFLTALADENQRVAQLVVRTPDMPATVYLDLIQRLVDHARNAAPSGVAVSAEAGLHSILEADRRILRSQTRSLWVALGIIGVALTLLWRSPWLAVLLVASNLLPISLAGAAAALGAIPLNSVTVLVAAVALGLAVDDGIHLLTRWRDLRGAGLGTNEALQKAIEAKARPILWTTVILVTTFGLLAFSSFPPVVHFGCLASVALSGSMLAVFVVMPASICAFAPAESASEPDGGERGTPAD